ncbi:MAG: prolyl oligopeptidase family serine peptidase [Phycisphaerae bacterium]|nr:prolyl oligopeptidase family serine peptidase [Phycisphaerae bacterium]
MRTTRVGGRIGGWLAGLACVAVVVGVSSPAPARPDGTLPARAVEASAWPARWASAERGSPGAIRPLDLSGKSLRSGRLPWQLGDGPNEAATAALLIPAAHEGPAPEFEFEGPGSVIFFEQPLEPKEKPDGATEHFVFVSARPGAAGADGAAGRPRVERTWFAYYAPKGEAKGLLLLIPGTFGEPKALTDRIVRQLQGRGFGVVRMVSQPSRFTEKMTFTIDKADPDSALGAIAGELGQRAAECAYAAEGAMAHVRAAHPEVAALPRFAVGASGGAMVMPTVLAREPGAYKAAVLIAGGADFFTTIDTSNYKSMIDAVSFRWVPEPPTDEERAALAARYLARAPLDSANTALAVRGTRFLLVHATVDMAVPAAQGDLLWERLGKPERWSEVAGHELIFVKVASRLGEMMDWLARP